MLKLTLQGGKVSYFNVDRIICVSDARRQIQTFDGGFDWVGTGTQITFEQSNFIVEESIDVVTEMIMATKKAKWRTEI
jgi:hypothetical protein